MKITKEVKRVFAKIYGEEMTEEQIKRKIRQTKLMKARKRENKSKLVSEKDNELIKEI